MSEDLWGQFDRMRQSIGANSRISYELAEALMEGFNRVKDERDALVAQVEDGKMLVREIFVDDVSDDATHLIEWAGIESSATSLSHRKAQWQAEILEELIQNTSQFREANPVRGLAGSMADELRRQAEGADHEN